MNAKYIINLLLAVLFSTACVFAQKTPKPQEVLATAKKVAAWQQQNLGDRPLNKAEYVAYYAGLMELFSLTNDSTYLQDVLKMGTQVRWEPQPRPFNASSLGVIQVFTEVFELLGDTSAIDKSRYVLDGWLIRWVAPDVRRVDNKYWMEWWSWSGALFMAPPAFARLSHVLDDPRYMYEADLLWWITSDYLYHGQDSLFLVNDKFAAGNKGAEDIFLARGTAWPFVGLTRLLDYLPQSHPSYSKYLQQYKEIAHKIKSLQRQDGFWNQNFSETNPKLSYKESSITACFVQGMAWGVNQQILPRREFETPILNGWSALMSVTDAEGKLGYVRNIGQKIEEVSLEDTETFGSGALILAASELYQFLNQE